MARVCFVEHFIVPGVELNPLTFERVCQQNFGFQSGGFTAVSLQMPGRPFENAFDRPLFNGGIRSGILWRGPSHISIRGEQILFCEVAFQTFLPIELQHRLDQFGQVALHDLVEFIQREVDAMIRASTLRKVVSANPFAAIARADQCPPG